MLLKSLSPALYAGLMLISLSAQEARRSRPQVLDSAFEDLTVERGASGMRDRKLSGTFSETLLLFNRAAEPRTASERKIAQPFTGHPTDSVDIESDDRELDLVSVSGLTESARERIVSGRAAITGFSGAGDGTRQATAFDPRAVMSSPSYGGTLDSQQLFSWRAGFGTVEYWLWAGSCQDCTDIFDGSAGRSQSYRVNMPMDGRRIYVTLFTFSQGLWYWHDYQYNAPKGVSNEVASMLSPSPGSTLAASQTFSWNRGSGVTSYWLWIGNCRDCTDILDVNMGRDTSYVTRIPTDGRAVYVTLFSLIDGNWYWYDYTYVAPPTVGTPLLVTLTITNKLSRAINIKVNGLTVGSVPANETRDHEMRASSIDFSWDLQRHDLGGRMLGDTMGGSFRHIANASGKYTFTIDNRVGDASYFNPWISNNSSNTLWVEANGGLNDQNRCNCTASPGAQRVSFGYYKLFSNSNVRGYRNSAYTGAYSYWGTDTNGSIGGRRIQDIAESETGITRLNVQ